MCALQYNSSWHFLEVMQWLHVTDNKTIPFEFKALFLLWIDPLFLTCKACCFLFQTFELQLKRAWLLPRPHLVYKVPRNRLKTVESKSGRLANTKITSSHDDCQVSEKDLYAQKEKFGHTFFTLTRYRAVDLIRSRKVIPPHEWQRNVFSSIPINTSRN